MPDFDARLLRCFESVFPGLTQEEIRTGSAEQGMWDSLSLVTLVAVVQEEFGVEILEEELPNLVSFAAFRAYLEGLRTPAKSPRLMQ
jgi:acyl carrier protein